MASPDVITLADSVMLERAAAGALIASAIVSVPIVRYRMTYETQKRFREVTPGKFYRCGQMSANAFKDKLKHHQIKLVINLQDENQDPLLPSGYWDKPHISESQVVQAAGAKFVFLSFAGDRGLLPRNEASSDNRPKVIAPSPKPRLTGRTLLRSIGESTAFWRIRFPSTMTGRCLRR